MPNRALAEEDGQQRKLSRVLDDLRQASSVLQTEADFLATSVPGKTLADFKHEPRLAAAAQVLAMLHAHTHGCVLSVQL